jgi:hypothetical protein
MTFFIRFSLIEVILNPTHTLLFTTGAEAKKKSLFICREIPANEKVLP